MRPKTDFIIFDSEVMAFVINYTSWAIYVSTMNTLGRKKERYFHIASRRQGLKTFDLNLELQDHVLILRHRFWYLHISMPNMKKPEPHDRFRPILSIFTLIFEFKVIYIHTIGNHCTKYEHAQLKNQKGARITSNKILVYTVKPL